MYIGCFLKKDVILRYYKVPLVIWSPGMKNEIQILKVIYKNNSLLAARISQILFTPVFQKFGPLYKFCGILSV